MTLQHFTYDPSRRALVLPNPRLTSVLQRNPASCASLDEYAQRAGLQTEDVLRFMGEALDTGALGLEVFGEQVFVHTAPTGRPGDPRVPETAPNLWERLRSHGDAGVAFALWRILRDLEDAGWIVESNPYEIAFGLGPLPFVPALGVRVQQQLLPLVLHLAPEAAASAGGPLTAYANAGAQAVGVLCDSGGLDAMVTAVRSWHMAFGVKRAPVVAVLEAPRYAPTILAPGDAAVRPRSVSQQFGGMQVLPSAG